MKSDRGGAEVPKMVVRYAKRQLYLTFTEENKTPALLTTVMIRFTFESPKYGALILEIRSLSGTNAYIFLNISI